MLKRREERERDTYLTHMCRQSLGQKDCCESWRNMRNFQPTLWLSLLTVQAAVLAESSSYFFNFHRTLSAPPMSTDMSQVGFALFPSFFIILPFQVFLLLIYLNFNIKNKCVKKMSKTNIPVKHCLQTHKNGRKRDTSVSQLIYMHANFKI